MFNPANQTIKVIVGLSGGVDSSVTAWLLKQQGYQVEGLFMKNWEGDDTDDYCPAAADLQDVFAVCERLDIPLHVENFAQEYWQHVFEHFLTEYQTGRTPNPDILCNKEIKFKAFLDHALALGADKIATGHYARVQQSTNGDYQLLKGLDPNKDQSYFLYTLQQYALSHTLFPIGHLPKPEVRQLAEAAGLVVHNKKDSTGICFIGERKFKDFLQRYLPAQPGDIVNEQGDKVGQHEGLMYYTLGQRKGLGIGGGHGESGEPWFVVDKNLTTNQLIVAQGDQQPSLYHRALSAQDLDWVSGEAPALNRLLTAKIRYRQHEQACWIRDIQPDDQNKAQIVVEFEQPQKAITPGQSIVFYDGELCLGGGVINARHDSWQALRLDSNAPI
ncbi:tRNA 2-thiouridine(34) synthase MnmA [Thiomicrospira sp. ALE5]|uniref:tRNA 2-thiouridine(34) synthase MnmA n=1 Tax=Thiomicrospira sp. ALE5 TaxID=748650 RepID=UPI0008EA30BB|nr:tRNA 2-thiouridine(34) synthase MnmA [Thiomicrospira sp. ALE5]SFR51896.1 tRNA-specific 2-thiouridylase [Thiomicrospira sp. ALE5]